MISGLYTKRARQFAKSGKKVENEPMTKDTLFIGHGSPMNALPGYAPGQAWQAALHQMGSQVLPAKKAILTISAHWQTRGSEVFASAEPHVIHDFIGFPKELHAFQYLAPGAVDEAKSLSSALKTEGQDVPYTTEWGYDHGVWSVLGHLAPAANIPVFMLSLDRRKTLPEHFELATAIGRNITADILVVASGNIVHALATMEEDPAAQPPSWAVEFDNRIAAAITAGDWKSLTDISREHGTPDKLSVPTLEHYVPLIYAAGISSGRGTPSKSPEFFYEGFDHATVSMRCVRFQ